MNRAGKLVRAACVAIAALHIAALAYVFARRLAYPYDLEWMEGGTLCHALRLAAGMPLYAPPSVDFIPFLYTPLYPVVIALFGKLTGIGYLLARAISISAYAGACVLGYRFAAREGGSRATAFAAIALPAAAFPLTGAFYDLARADSLWLLFTTAGFVVLFRAARDPAGHRYKGRDLDANLRAAASAALFVLAFLTKQTASPLMVAAGLALLVLNPRLVPAFAGALSVLGLPSLYLLNRTSGGWFWKYVFALHQGHDFYAARAFLDTPLALVLILGPALVLVPWALYRRPSLPLYYATFVAAAAIGTACVASGTQWAVTNAYIPGVFFPSVAIGLAAGRLVGLRAMVRHEPLPRLRAPVVFGALLASLLCKLPALDGRGDDAFLNLSRARLVHRFDLRRFIPTAADRQAGDALVERLRAASGDVLVPFHPFYAHLAGKPTFVHQMGVMDVGRAGLGVPAGLTEAIRDHRFGVVILDDKIFDKWPWWPGLRESYEEREHIRGPHVVSGAQTVPSIVMVPRVAVPPPPPTPSLAPTLEVEPADPAPTDEDAPPDAGLRAIPPPLSRSRPAHEPTPAPAQEIDREIQ